MHKLSFCQWKSLDVSIFYLLHSWLFLFTHLTLAVAVGKKTRDPNGALCFFPLLHSGKTLPQNEHYSFVISNQNRHNSAI